MKEEVCWPATAHGADDDGQSDRGEAHASRAFRRTGRLGHARRDMIQSDERVRFTAAQRGLQLDDRQSLLAGQAGEHPTDRGLQPLVVRMKSLFRYGPSPK
mgnify:CR=1 FL=1